MHSTLFDAIDPAEQRLTAHVRAWTDQAIVPIDAAEIARRATATTGTPGLRARLPGGVPGDPTLRSPSVVSATRFIAAIALVALGTGALLLAGSPGPSPAVSPSPSPTWTPLSGLVTEEVAPGVLRVVSDDAGHDLASLGVVEIAVGLDGAVWMNGRGGLFRLRGPGIADGIGTSYRSRLTVAPDGTVWDAHYPSRTIRSYDGDGWFSRSGFPGAEVFAVGPDGSVWAAKPDENWSSDDGRKPPGFELARLDGDAWAAVDLDGWPDRWIGNGSRPYAPGIAATADGAVWLVAGDLDSAPTVLARFDGRGWDFITIPSGVSAVLQLTAGPDGSIWVFGIDGESTARMARYTDGAWTVVETPPGIRPGTHYGAEDALRPVVTSDGAVWIRRIGNTERLSQTYCDGLLRYDGTWTGYLADHCVHSVAAGPRGEAWVVTGPIDDQSGEPTNTGVYLIDPRTSARVGE